MQSTAWAANNPITNKNEVKLSLISPTSPTDLYFTFNFLIDPAKVPCEYPGEFKVGFTLWNQTAPEIPLQVKSLFKLATPKANGAFDYSNYLEAETEGSKRQEPGENYLWRPPERNWTSYAFDVHTYSLANGNYIAKAAFDDGCTGISEKILQFKGIQIATPKPNIFSKIQSCGFDSGKEFAGIDVIARCTLDSGVGVKGAELQQLIKSKWTWIQNAEKPWSGYFDKIVAFRLYYNTPGTYKFRVVVKSDSLNLTSKEFSILIEKPKPQPVTKTKTKSSAPTKTQNTQFVTIPNYLGMSVQWVRTHPNAYPGIHAFISGSSCAISDLLSGDAIVVSQNPAPMQKRVFNTTVTLGTNC